MPRKEENKIYLLIAEYRTGCRYRANRAEVGHTYIHTCSMWLLFLFLQLSSLFLSFVLVTCTSSNKEQGH